MTHGTGVFRKLLHVIPDDAQTIEFHGIDVTFGECNVPCVPIQESPTEGAWPPCHPCAACFPSHPCAGCFPPEEQQGGEGDAGP